MFEDTFFPEWLEQYLVPDDVFGYAYENVPAQRRAWLKTTIARLDVLYGANSVTWGQTERHFRQAFSVVKENRPAEWAVVLLDEAYASGPRLLAGVMMPLLAGVEDVLVVRVLSDKCNTGSQPACAWNVNVLAALELAGQERVIDLPQEKLTALFEELALESDAAGRILSFGTTTKSNDDILRRMNFSQEYQHWQEPPVLYVANTLDGEVDLDVLQWAHPDLSIVPVSLDKIDDAVLTHEGFGAAVCSADQVDTIPNAIPYVLGPGQEGCWVWPELVPGFFVQRRVSLFADNS